MISSSEGLLYFLLCLTLKRWVIVSNPRIRFQPHSTDLLKLKYVLMCLGEMFFRAELTRFVLPELLHTGGGYKQQKREGEQNEADAKNHMQQISTVLSWNHITVQSVQLQQHQFVGPATYHECHTRCCGFCSPWTLQQIQMCCTCWP